MDKILFVENFPLDTTEIKLKKLFTNFGTVRHIELPTFQAEHPLNRGQLGPRSKGYAFIEFINCADAKKACDFFNDLRNIFIPSDEEQVKSENAAASDDDDYKPSDNNLRNKIIFNLEYKKLVLMRVMMKQAFLDLTKRYDEQRFQCLVKTAKLFVLA